MPIYEYRCASCGYQNEYLQRVSEPLLTDCPECRQPTFNKLVSAAGFQLKGSGWYATDFKNNGKKPQPEKEKDKEKEKAADKPSETKTETKSEAACGTGACPTCS